MQLDDIHMSGIAKTKSFYIFIIIELPFLDQSYDYMPDVLMVQPKRRLSMIWKRRKKHAHDRQLLIAWQFIKHKIRKFSKKYAVRCAGAPS